MLFKQMDFKKKIKSKIWIAAALVFNGIATWAVVTLSDVSFDKNIHDFYFGLGFSIVILGIVMLFRNIIYLKNNEKFKKKEIQYHDERNRFIASKVWSVSSYIMLCFLYFAVIVSGMFNITVFNTLLVVLGVFGVVLIIVKIVLNKIY